MVKLVRLYRLSVIFENIFNIINNIYINPNDLIVFLFRYILFEINNINLKLLENTTTLFINLIFDDDILIE